MLETFDYCYECKNITCGYFWYSPESDLKKIEKCPECGETENIGRCKTEKVEQAVSLCGRV